MWKLVWFDAAGYVRAEIAGIRAPVARTGHQGATKKKKVELLCDSSPTQNTQSNLWVVLLELLEVCAQHPVASLRFHAKEIVLVKITHTEVGLPLRN